MPRTVPDFSHETIALSQGALHVVGVDEVGRGPLAGPVTAAAVRLDPARIPAGLRDSKQLTAARREALFPEIMACAEVSIAHATVEEIDSLNILRASHLAMERAIAGLAADHALIDGNKRLGWVSVRLFYRLNERDLHAPIDDAFDLVVEIAGGSLRDVPAIAARLRVWVGDPGASGG